MLSQQDEFSPLIMDGHLGCDETRVTLGGEVDDLKRRIQRVPGMHLFKELARQFGEGYEDLSDVMRKKGCAWSGESQDLQTMDHWSAVSVSLCPFDVIMDRVIIRRDCLERRCMRIGECSTRRAKHLSDSQVLKLTCRHYEEFIGIKRLGNFAATSTYTHKCPLTI